MAVIWRRAGDGGVSVLILGTLIRRLLSVNDTTVSLFFRDVSGGLETTGAASSWKNQRGF